MNWKLIPDDFSVNGKLENISRLWKKSPWYLLVWGRGLGGIAMKLSAIFVLLFAAPAMAQTPPPPAQLKAKGLMELCEATGIAESGMCLAYLNGFNDMHKISVMTGGQAFYCMTQYDTMEGAADKYAKVLRVTPEVWSEAAYMAVLSVWKITYPCKR